VVRPALVGECVMLGFNADLLPEFASHCLFMGFSVVHPSLRELPCSRRRDSLSNKNPTVGTTQNRRDIRLVFHSTDWVLRRHILLIAALATLALGAWCLSRWQPDRQVRRHTEQLLAAIEDKHWQEMAGLMGDEYSDRWGHDKATLVDHSKQAFAQFFVLTVTGSDLEVEESNGIGRARTHVAVTGRGGPLADLVLSRATELKQPFSFTWRQASWKPWDWKLIRIDQPELEVPEY